ncbi:hypothetical protein N657DRAFT_634263 [Parathielavia appendiculata]|uniref:Uncharacterized protein n=1 Tax=Parathielavia appendiculata TaxID=2587402 RepID=A0AAN6TYH5_9PEZI|nr:hypothetical protein N657DRAFT_634263 [Parathielavia appendiculata]
MCTAKGLRLFCPECSNPQGHDLPTGSVVWHNEERKCPDCQKWGFVALEGPNPNLTGSEDDVSDSEEEEEEEKEDDDHDSGVEMEDDSEDEAENDDSDDSEEDSDEEYDWELVHASSSSIGWFIYKLEAFVASQKNQEPPHLYQNVHRAYSSTMRTGIVVENPRNGASTKFPYAFGAPAAAGFRLAKW